jgi:hypothetical protein
MAIPIATTMEAVIGNGNAGDRSLLDSSSRERMPETGAEAFEMRLIHP